MKNFQSMIEKLSRLLDSYGPTMGPFLPKLLGALAIIILGYCIAYLLRFLFNRLPQQLNRLFPSLKIDNRLRKIGLRPTFFALLGKIVFWIVILFTLIAVTEVFHLEIVTTWLSGLTTYLPRLLSAFLIGFVGITAGSGVRGMVTRASAAAGANSAAILGKITQGIILIITTILVVSQIGIKIEFLVDLSIVVFGILFGSIALSFGLGSKNLVSNILAIHYFQKQYHIGQLIQVAGKEGRIVKILPTAVILESGEGQVMIPATEFTEQISTLLSKGKL
ncbi:MAG: mechanosensitive ion channel [SAR324 cluster bacterium]|nr:mechanosensitive ion channel [SAR324 cluster bacterium]